VKCIRCQHDRKYKDRKDGACPKCRHRFAFEPRHGAKLTDQAFQHAIDRVSGNGTLRWGAEHLYYELGRRMRPRFWLRTRSSQIVGIVVAAIGLVVTYQLGLVFMLGFLLIVGGLIALQWRRSRTRTIGLEEHQFRHMLATWSRTHGQPEGLIVRPSLPAGSRSRRLLEADIADYSFDRAVICDRARTVDLLLANNFHFENNCAVLAIEGYPPGPFETVRTMLKRNPKLRVFALHDATVAGCTLAHRLTSDPAWFAGQVPVTDVGLRPGHAGPFRGLWLPAAIPHVPLDGGIKPAEAEWLQQYALELAAIRPDQVLKRLFRAMNRQPDDDDSDDGGDILIFDGGSDGSDGGDSYVIEDDDSFGSDADADDGGADSFG
jgi:hypothetical protein